MTEEERAELKAEIRGRADSKGAGPGYKKDVRFLLSEVDRLTAQVQALREALEMYLTAGFKAARKVAAENAKAALAATEPKP